MIHSVNGPMSFCLIGIYIMDHLPTRRGTARLDLGFSRFYSSALIDIRRWRRSRYSFGMKSPRNISVERLVDFGRTFMLKIRQWLSSTVSTLRENSTIQIYWPTISNGTPSLILWVAINVVLNVDRTIISRTNRMNDTFDDSESWRRSTRIPIWSSFSRLFIRTERLRESERTRSILSHLRTRPIRCGVYIKTEIARTGAIRRIYGNCYGIPCRGSSRRITFEGSKENSNEIELQWM